MENRVASTPGAEASRQVVVCYGRDTAARDKVFTFLTRHALTPVDFLNAKARRVPDGLDFNFDIVLELLKAGSAVVVILTPDETAELRQHLHRDSDTPDDRRRTQPRPNVFLELGLAIALRPKEVVIIEFGGSIPSDLRGLHPFQWSSKGGRKMIWQRLNNLGLPIAPFRSRVAASRRREPPHPVLAFEDATIDTIPFVSITDPQPSVRAKTLALVQREGWTMQGIRPDQLGAYLAKGARYVLVDLGGSLHIAGRTDPITNQPAQNWIWMPAAGGTAPAQVSAPRTCSPLKSRQIADRVRHFARRSG